MAPKIRNSIAREENGEGIVRCEFREKEELGSIRKIEEKEGRGGRRSLVSKSVKGGLL